MVVSYQLNFSFSQAVTNWPLGEQFFCAF